MLLGFTGPTRYFQVLGALVKDLKKEHRLQRGRGTFQEQSDRGISDVMHLKGQQTL